MLLNKSYALVHLLLGYASTTSALPNSYSANDDYKLRSFEVDLSDGVNRMLSLARDYQLPDKELYPELGMTAGIDLDVLKELRTQWVNGYDWQEDQDYINSFHHYTAEIDGFTTHFIHERSEDAEAIPLILEHGWPGSFLEFAPLIKELTRSARTSSGRNVSFHVIVPSLPGFAFSQAPPANWTPADTARLHHTLLTEVLGYDKYAVHGTDWGAPVAYSLYDTYNQSTRAGHFAFLPFLPLNISQMAAENITLSPVEVFQVERFQNWSTIGFGYFLEQATRPNTIGLGIQDSPVGQLAWIGEKWIIWSDPRAGTGASVLTFHEILRTVSLYYLTKSFQSSLYAYFRRSTGFSSEYTKADTDAPLLFSGFKYNVGFWPEELVERVGNLVYYRNHEFGGHFPGVDNPPAMLEDLREIGTFWKE